MLPEDKFFRCHRTYLAGLRHIVSHTSTDILFDNKERALISRIKLTPFKKAFTDYIKRYNLRKGL
jgi:DNA-binding LytR/AlgR family response regulator